MYYKQYVARVFFVVEILIFLWIYFFGALGLHTLWQLQHENNKTQQAVSVLQEEVSHLEHELYAWQHHPFYKEKLAREQLQMARPGEQIYYLS